MEDEGQVKEIPLATAQPVHAYLGSLWYRQSYWNDVSRSRKDPLRSSRHVPRYTQCFHLI
jgi:hypothetical protein